MADLQPSGRYTIELTDHELALMRMALRVIAHQGHPTDREPAQILLADLNG